MWWQRQSLAVELLESSYKAYGGLKVAPRGTVLPLVSVVMTAYNAERTIEASVKSLLTQAYPNLEVIVVDDASTDGTFRLLEGLAKRDPRVRIVRLPENHGTYVAKNAAIREAKGDIIMFQDSDDYSHPERLMVQVLPLLSEPTLWATRTKFVRESPQDGRVVPINQHTEVYGFITLAVRRRIFEEIGYFEGVRKAADEEWYGRIIRFLGRETVRLLDVTLYRAELRPGSLMSDSIGREGDKARQRLTQERRDYVAMFRQRYLEKPQGWFRETFLGCPKASTTDNASDMSAPSSHPLDIATRIMLANAGTLTLTESERKDLLAQHQEVTAKKSRPIEVKPVSSIPKDWPADVVLPALPESPNDFVWLQGYQERTRKIVTREEPFLSVVIPTFNRARILSITLACLVRQQTEYPFEVIVVDDGSKEDICSVVRFYEDKLDIRYVRQKDEGYQLCRARNLGLRAARGNFVAILDCDMAPNFSWVQAYMEKLTRHPDVALVGPRKYIDTCYVSIEGILEGSVDIADSPEVLSFNTVSSKAQKGVSVDWRLDTFKKTLDLQMSEAPYRFFSGGNVAFARKWLDLAGWFDEDFNHWGGEDNEFGYRLFRAGCFFRTSWGALAYHQEPPGRENETDRAEGAQKTRPMLAERVPYMTRTLVPLDRATIHVAPLVSIYVPAYNCADTIERCVDSALNQTITDLEVVVCDDGSTDNTWEVLQRYVANPRVRLVRKENGGIGSASNAAIRAAKGFYIGQLDSDDYLDADSVEICLREFFSDRTLVCVYAGYQNIFPDGTIKPGYNWPVFSREKMTASMIVHSFRMFTARAWHIVGGHSERLLNAVDYDFYLKLSEVGGMKHVNRICYNRTLQGENTSIRNEAEQTKNHFRVVNASLLRQGIPYRYVSLRPDDPTCRQGRWEKLPG